MNFFERFLCFLQSEMNEPIAFGWFHLMWIMFVIVILVILYKLKDKSSEKKLKYILGIYGIVALVLEILKQLIWSFNYDSVTGIVSWNYEWYSFPFQLCTTPIYVSLICLYLKDSKIRNSLLSYMSFITIWGGLMTILLPDSCLVSDILVNIHTMWLHCGSFVISVYLLMSGVVKLEKENLLGSFYVFLIFVFIAELLNVGVYHSGILNGQEFNMFYISPYFISSLPIFNVIQEHVPFILYLLMYIGILFLGSIVIYYFTYFIKKVVSKKI